MNLSVAVLCLDCDEIHAGVPCPKCGSRASAPLAPILNRTITTAPPERRHHVDGTSYNRQA